MPACGDAPAQPAATADGRRGHAPFAPLAALAAGGGGGRADRLPGPRPQLMRALLTMLGVVIGVAAVIAVMEISRGASTAIQVTVSNLGANTLTVSPWCAEGRIGPLRHADRHPHARGCRGHRPRMSLRRRHGPHRRRLGPGGLRQPQLEHRHDGQHGQVPQKMRNWSNLEYGRVFNDRELLSGEKVCLIGQTLVRELFRQPLPHRRRDPREERALYGHRRAQREGRQLPGHGPGRHPRRPLDHRQVPPQRR